MIESFLDNYFTWFLIGMSITVFLVSVFFRKLTFSFKSAVIIRIPPSGFRTTKLSVSDPKHDDPPLPDAHTDTPP